VVLRHNLVFGGGLKDDDDNGACHLVGNTAGKDPRFLNAAKCGRRAYRGLSDRRL
jgi:hypothetical protein